MGFYRSKQSGKLGLSFLCICTFRKDEGLDEAVKMQLWACHCAVCQAHDPLAPLLCSNSGKGSLVVDFSPAGVSYPDDEFLRHAWVTWKPDVNIFQAVCVGLAYARLRGKWTWSEVGLQRGGAGEARSPSSSQWDHFCQGKRRMLAVLVTAAQHLCPHPLHWQTLPRLFVMNLVNRTKIKGLI